MLLDDTVIGIVSTDRIGDYKLRLRFSDGFERIVDFEPFLRNSLNPWIREYLAPEKFATFRIEDGNLIWDDYGLCFPISDLYENSI